MTIWLASYLCRTPIAAISCVDAERQWFKSSVGLDHKEARREGAFCAHTIAGTDVFMVENADADERFKNHPWVVEQPALRFYAGVPLMTPDGYAIGSLAVMDEVPRTLSPEQLTCLRTIANQVMAQLELRRTARLDNRHKPDRWEERVIKQKQVEEIFREDEHKFRAIFEQAPVGIATIDSLTGRFLSVNTSLCAIVGYANEEMLSRTFLDITHPDDIQADLDQMKRLLDGETATFEMGKRQFKKNGDTIWVHLTCVSLWQRLSDPRMHVAIVQDITERKRAEERMQQFQNELEQLVESRTADLQRTHRLLQSVIDSSPDWIFVKDREHRFVLVNKAFAASQQRTPADMADRLDTDFWPQELCEGNAAKGIRGFHTDDRRAFAGELIRNPYDPASLHDGALRIFDTYKGPWHDPSGQIGGVLCYARDVTEQRRAEESVRQLNSELAIRVDERTAELAQANRMLEADIAERKRVEEERSKQELLISLMLSTGPGCIKRVAADGTVLHMNPAGLTMIEVCQEEEAIGLSVFDLILPEHRTAFINMHQDVINGASRILQFEIQGLKGGRRWMETHAVPFRNPGTGSIEHLAVTHDITERKQAEKALRENEQAIRALHEATAVIGLSFDERIQAILEVGCRRFTMPIGMLTQAVGERLVFTHVCAPGTGFTAGMEAPLGNTYCNTTLQRNKPVYFEHAGVSDWRNHPGYKALGLESYIGTKLIGREQAYGTICFAGQDPHPAPFSQSDEDFIQLMARWISGELDRQQAEQALKHSEERYRSLYDDTPTMYFTLATDGTVRSVNRFGAEQLLYQVEELIGHSVLGLFHEDDKETVAASLSECLATPETTKHWEFRKVRKDGSLLWVRETVKVGQSSTRETVVLVTCEDVTERKRTEQALTFFRTLLDYVNDSIEIIDPQTGKFLDGNKGAASNIGYTRDELLGLTVPDIDPLVTPPIFADVMKRLREEPGPLVLDSIHRRKDGTTFPVEVSAQLIRLEKDYCVAIVRDSTERKRAEHEVSERIQQTLQMQAALLRLTHLDDTGVPFSDVLPRVCEIVAETLGVARVSVWQLSENGTELVCQNLYDRSHAVHSAGNRLSALQYPRYLETIAASLVAAAPDACADPRMSEFVEHYFRPLGITSVMDVPIRHQGTLVGVLWHEHVGVPRDWNSEAQSFGVSVGEILGRMMETVERTRAEEALRSSEERFRLVAETTLDILWDRDCGTNKMWWSPNARVKFGGDPSGEVWVSRLHPDDRDRVLAQVQDALSSKALRYSAEYRFRLEDGSYGHFLDRASIIQDSSGKPTRMIGAMIDMTSAKKAYLSLQEAYHPGFRS